MVEADACFVSCRLESAAKKKERKIQVQMLSGATRALGSMKSIVMRMEVSVSLAEERWALLIAPPTHRSSAKSHLKIIKTDIAERSADARERFVREARAAAALRHEHIATVYQFGMRLETGQYFYAMELIEGETLDERVHRAGPLDARSTIGIAQQVTSALAAAEKHGLVHRDLKPANLMLVKADDPEVMDSDQARCKRSKIRELRKSGIPLVKIIDFGLAKAFHTATDPKSLTHDRFVGTPAFASPKNLPRKHSGLHSACAPKYIR